MSCQIQTTDANTPSGLWQQSLEICYYITQSCVHSSCNCQHFTYVADERRLQMAYYVLECIRSGMADRNLKFISCGLNFGISLLSESWDEFTTTSSDVSPPFIFSTKTVSVVTVINYHLHCCWCYGYFSISEKFLQDKFPQTIHKHLFWNSNLHSSVHGF